MISRFLVFLCVSVLSVSTFAQVQQVKDDPAAVIGVGKHFEIAHSEFIDIIVESTNDVLGYVKSAQEKITINIAKPNATVYETSITVRNLTPGETYYLTKNGSTETIIVGETGTHAMDLDLSIPQKMLITK
ncbi:MAG: hypothetical protein ACOC41_05320 [Chitinivibrionales bacterium]